MAATLTAMNLKNNFLIENVKKCSQQQQVLSRRYEQLLVSEKYYDCMFVVGEVGKVKCHKLILASASPVFEAMFYGPISEMESFVEILDMSPEMFQLMILYIYKGSIDFHNLTLEETIELYYGAEKYLLNDLKSECLENIQMKLRFSNILASLELSICLDLNSLLDICMNFFTRCCLSDGQFVTYLKTNYYHVSKDCIKTIINLCKEVPAHNLLWFVYEWCQQECAEMGLKSSECSSIIEDLNLAEPVDSIQVKESLKPQYVQTVERCYYKACRPFNINYDNFTWCTYLKSNRFISLQGLTLHSRLTPHLARTHVPTDYLENLCIEITASPQNESSLKWTFEVNKQLTKYNCDLNIKWSNGIVLSPDVEYQIKLIWRPDRSQGAEYPCSLFSNLVDGIQFRDVDTHSGSLIKGLHFINLL